MNGRCSKFLRIIGGAGDGKSNDDPDDANTEQGYFHLIYYVVLSGLYKIS